MAPTSQERDENLVYEVTIHHDGSVAETATFETLSEAEMFADEWTERVVGASFVIEDRSHDHTAWEAVEADSGPDSDYPRDSG